MEKVIRTLNIWANKQEILDKVENHYLVTRVPDNITNRIEELGTPEY